MASPEGCRDAQLGVPRPGRVAPGTRSRRRAPPTEASSGPFLLCTGRVEAEGNLNLFAQRSVGYAVVDIAAILGVREGTVSRWCSRYERGGQEALPGDRTGRPIGSGRRLDGEQERRIQEAIETKAPQELEVPSALWTRQAVQELIE